MIRSGIWAICWKLADSSRVRPKEPRVGGGDFCLWRPRPTLHLLEQLPLARA